MSINLRPYQQVAIDKMFGTTDPNGKKTSNGLYDTKRFAAVFLPTGGGKSFVSMEAMNRMMKVSENPKNPFLISETSMLYMSPNTPIIGQFQIHMAQNMIFEHHIKRIENRDGETTKERLVQVAEEVLKSFHPNIVIEQEVINTVIEKNSGLSADRLLRLVLKSQLTSQDTKIIEGTKDANGNWIGGVRAAFPNLQFKCYQAMRSRKAKDVIESTQEEIDSEKLFYVEDIEAEFVITDEAHRGAADDWSKYLERFVDAPKHKKTKYLAITATPDRDADDYSIINTIASKTGYTTREVRKKEYIAQYLELIEAMKQKLVVTPKVVHFNCTLDQTKAYRDVVEKIKELKSKSEGKRGNQVATYSDALRAYETILGRMHALMGRDKDMTDEQWKVKQSELIAQEIRNSGLSDDAKCIAFIPKTEDYQDPQVHIGRYETEIQDRIMNGLGLSKEKVYSQGYHSAFSKKQNDETLRKFNKFEGKTSGVKVIITNAKLNEGVHVDDTQALFMYDEIRAENASVIKQTPKIKFMQQMGRCIFSIDPNGPEPERPIIFDIAHNILWQRHLLKDADENIFFDITPQEAEFIELYNIFLHNPVAVSYVPSKDFNMSRGNYDKEIERIIKSGFLKFKFKEKNEKGNPLTVQFPEGKPELTPSLIRKVRVESGKRYNSKGLPLTELASLNVKERFEKMLAVLNVLKKYGINVQNIDETIPFSEEFLEANNITGEQKEKLLDELYESRPGKSIAENFEGLVYPLGDEMKIFKDAFYGTPSKEPGVKKTAKKLIDKMTFAELSELGIISVDLLNIPEELKDKISQKGFIKPNEGIPEEYWGLNIKTGTKYLDGRDEIGLDENGLDVCGYDKNGFKTVEVMLDGKKQTIKVHKITGQDYNENFFRLDDKTGKWTNIITQRESDLLGYNHEAIEVATGFDRGIRVGDKRIRMWHPKVNGIFSRLISSTNDKGANHYGFKGRKIVDEARGNLGSEYNYEGFVSTLIYKGTNGKYTWEGYNADGENRAGFTKVKIKKVIKGKTVEYAIHGDTSTEYNLAARDENGCLHPALELTARIVRDMITYKMKPEQVYNKYKSEPDVSKLIDEALTIYSISPDLEDKYTTQQLLANKEIFNVLGKLSPRFKVQMAIRQADKQAIRDDLRAQFQNKCKEGNMLQEEMIRLVELDKKLERTIIVRPSAEEQMR